MTRLTADAVAGGPDGPVVLRVQGTLDLDSAPVLREALARCLPAEPELIVLDLSTLAEVTANAASSLAALGDQACAWPGSRVVVGGPSPPVATLLNVTGVADRLPVYPTVRDALGAPPGNGSPYRRRLTLAPSVSAAARARRLVDRVCAEWGLPVLRDLARLVVTELVSNAVRHAGTALEVTLSRRADAVHIGVRDRSRKPPRLGGPVPATVEGGRGLLVIDIMCRSWGTTPVPDGKVVWASLATGRFG